MRKFKATAYLRGQGRLCSAVFPAADDADAYSYAKYVFDEAGLTGILFTVREVDPSTPFGVDDHLTH